MVKKIASTLLIVAFIIALAACGSPQASWQEQYDLGVRHLSEGNYEEAVLAFTAAIEIDAKQAPAYAGRGDAYAAWGQPDNAAANYEQAISLDANQAEWYIKLADAYIASGDTDSAIRVLEDGLTALPDNEELRNKLDELNAPPSDSADEEDTAESSASDDRQGAAESAVALSIKIPECDAVFTLENAGAEYGLLQADVAEYIIALPGTEGMVTCDMPASSELGLTYRDNPDEQPYIGGGFGISDTSWSYDFSNVSDAGQGIKFVTVFVLQDGSLSVAEEPGLGEEFIAKITFVFGYPIPYGTGEIQLPDNLIESEAELRPISELAVVDDQ